MIPVSGAEKILAEKTFFVSTFLDKYTAESQQNLSRRILNLDFIPNQRKLNLNFIPFSLD